MEFWCFETLFLITTSLEPTFGNGYLVGYSRLGLNKYKGASEGLHKIAKD
jgi:hypothetical protein